MTYKVDDLVVITKNINNHGFEMGELVQIDTVYSDDDIGILHYRVRQMRLTETGDHIYYYVQDMEIEPVLPTNHGLRQMLDTTY